MQTAEFYLILLMPWFILTLLILIPYQLLVWARKQHVGAIVFGSAMQIMLPDPYAQRTIEIITDQKQELKQEKENNGKSKEETTDN